MPYYEKKPASKQNYSPYTIKLPDPRKTGETPLEETINNRRSLREYSKAPLELADLSQLLWAAQGLTDENGKRTVPSAGALYPIEIYIAVEDVYGLEPGVYKYTSGEHSLALIKTGEFLNELSKAALNQPAVKRGVAAIVIAGVYERTTSKYSDRGKQYVHMEVGCASQNVYLQTESLNLGTVFIGAFEDDKVKQILNMAENETPFSIMPIGRRLE
ncbi:SagB/ThcOx family dehydrogenase [Patescibacteria group bacterium]|nr:SagB/ThcOx family dehydrogenase [Patescibacteria group bacterium]